MNAVLNQTIEEFHQEPDQFILHRVFPKGDLDVGI